MLVQGESSFKEINRRQKQRLPAEHMGGFTLVELLVVIGIIRMLISILLPALTKARDQANMVVCQSTERQFYACWEMYTVDFKGYVLPCASQGINVEYDFCESQLIGQEVGKATGGSGSNNTIRTMDNAAIVKMLFTCPAANHSGDPNTLTQSAIGTSQAAYWGDYIYNTQMGYLKISSNTSSGVIYPFFNVLKVSQVPGNVIILMESMKPNYTASSSASTGMPSGYKDYFADWPDLFGTANAAAKSTNSLTLSRIATPHSKNTKMNVLCADGHISLVNPKKDFFVNPADQRTVKEYLWDAAITAGSVTTPPSLETTPQYINGGWRRGAPGI